MEQQRLILIMMLGVLSLFMYMQWQQDFGPKQPTATKQQSSSTGSKAIPDAGTSTEKPKQSDDVIMPAPKSNTSAQTDTTPDKVVADSTEKSQAQVIKVKTDVLHVSIDTKGGRIKVVDLPKYPVSVDEKDKPFRFMDVSANRVLNAQHGFFVASGDKNFAGMTPKPGTVYSAEQTEYTLDGETLNVDLKWTNQYGMVFTQRFTFNKGSYTIKISHKVDNPSQQVWSGNTYARLQRIPAKEEGGLFMMPTYTGPVYYHPEDKYNKVDFDDIDDLRETKGKNEPLDAINKEFAGGWVAMIEKHFVTAFVPEAKDTYSYFTTKTERDGNKYLIGVSSTEKTVKPGESATTDIKLYVGPKIQNDLEALAPGLELTVDYGWLTIISKPLFWLMDKIHSLIGNWGWSIILLTLLIKLAFYKLSEASYKSMARLKKLAPRMKQINDRYADDRQRKGQAIMELYRKEKVNPLGGCLPILIQIPVFIALYYVLLESVEIRQAEWIFWFNDLSQKDPYFVLPILMGASMLFQQKLNPPPPDPMQAKMMMMLPIVFTVLFLFFPSGLVLYWVVNNVLSIAQQWYITRIVMDEPGKSSKAKS